MDAANTVLTGKFTALSDFVRKEETSNTLRFHLRN
jgi:hypothetical protein